MTPLKRSAKTNQPQRKQNTHKKNKNKTKQKIKNTNTPQNTPTIIPAPKYNKTKERN